MPINRTAAMVLNADGAPVKPADVASASGITTGQASTELSRLVRMGIARKIGRGEYSLIDRQKAVDFLQNNKHNNTTKDTIGGTVVPAGILVRPHRIWFKTRVQNVPVIKDPVKAGPAGGRWRVWEPNQHSKMYEREAALPNGTAATVRYAEGHRKRTVTVQCEAVMVKGDTLAEHMRDIIEAVEAHLRALCRNDGFQFGLIELTCDQHFGIALPVEKGWQLPPPGIVKVNDFWWLDQSTGWPELETHLQAQARRLVELPERVDRLPTDIREAIRQTLDGYFKPQARALESPLAQGQEVA